MSRARLRAPLVGALITASLAGAVFLGGATSANAEDAADTRVKNYQEQFIDPQAPIGTEAKSSKKANANVQLDSPVATTAANPDSASDLTALAETAGGSWQKLPSLPSGSNAYHLIMGPGGKILLIAGSGNSSTVFAAGTFKSYIWTPTTGATQRAHDVRTSRPGELYSHGHVLCWAHADEQRTGRCGGWHDGLLAMEGFKGALHLQLCAPRPLNVSRT